MVWLNTLLLELVQPSVYPVQLGLIHSTFFLSKLRASILNFLVGILICSYLIHLFDFLNCQVQKIWPWAFSPFLVISSHWLSTETNNVQRTSIPNLHSSLFPGLYTSNCKQWVHLSSLTQAKHLGTPLKANFLLFPHSKSCCKPCHLQLCNERPRAVSTNFHRYPPLTTRKNM